MAGKSGSAVTLTGAQAAGSEVDKRQGGLAWGKDGTALPVLGAAERRRRMRVLQPRRQLEADAALRGLSGRVCPSRRWSLITIRALIIQFHDHLAKR
jgi:hypothetical protein